MPVELVIIKNDFPTMTPKMRRAVSRRINDSVHRIEGGAKQKAPVDTGQLRNSIASSMESELTGVVSVGAEYGGYVELGTRYMAAQPYLKPSVDEERPKFEASCVGIEGDLG